MRPASARDSLRPRAEGEGSGPLQATQSEIDVTGLAPSEAIARLTAANAALTDQKQALDSHVRKLKVVHEDNSSLRDELAALQRELAERADAHKAATSKHRARLERLQAASEAMVAEVEAARELGAANAALRAEVETMRFRLIMQSAPEVPESAAAQWEAMKTSLVRGSPAPVTALPLAQSDTKLLLRLASCRPRMRACICWSRRGEAALPCSPPQTWRPACGSWRRRTAVCARRWLLQPHRLRA